MSQLLIRRSEITDLDQVLDIFNRRRLYFDAFLGNQDDNEESKEEKNESKTSEDIFSIDNEALKDFLSKSYLNVTVVDSDDGVTETVVGFATFDYSPSNRSALTTECWLQKLKESEYVKHPDAYLVSNTLFLTSFVALENYETETIDLVARTLFCTLPQTDFILASLSPFSRNNITLSSFQPLCDGETEVVVYCPRIKYVENLDCRPAKVEDYDELVKIFDEQSEVLSNVYGEFFLAELIESQDETNKAVSVTFQDKAVGLMSLCSDVDTNILVSNFELQAFSNLRKTISITRERTVRVKVERSELNESKENDDDAPAADDYTDLEITKEEKSAEALNESEEENSEAQNEDDSEKKEEKEENEYTLRTESYEEVMEQNNVFAVTLFAIDSQHEGRAFDILEGAFDAFPDCEYCSLTLPHDAQENTLVPFFTAVPTRRGSTFSHSLYLFHRDALRTLRADYMLPEENQPLEKDLLPWWIGGSQLQVQKQNNKIHDIRAISSALDVEELTELHNLIQDNERQCFVATVLKSVVGVVVLKKHMREEDKDFVRQIEHRFDISPSSNDEASAPSLHICDTNSTATIEKIIINPIFSRSSRTILKEVMRLSCTNTLYFRLGFGYAAPLCVLEEMVQVRPRRLPMETSQPISNEFSLFVLRKRDLSEPKYRITSRIVVVGASETGLSAIESLLMVPHVYFSNITLVTAGGVAGIDASKSGLSGLCTVGTAAKGTYDTNRLIRNGFQSRVQVLDAKLKHISEDIEASAIVLDNGAIFPFDYLLLTTGLQDSTFECIKKNIPGWNSLLLNEEDAKIFSISSDPACAHILREKIKENTINSPEEPCVVFGDSIEALTVVHNFLSQGKPGKAITLVQPTMCSDDNKKDEAKLNALIYEPVVAGLVLKELKESGVNIISGAKIAGIEDNGSLLQIKLRKKEIPEAIENNIQSLVRDQIESEMFEKKTPLSPETKTECDPSNIQTMDASILILADKRDVNKELFDAVNNIGLVYDGRLVVNGAFQTANRRIFGAGTLAKFSRKYGITVPMERFNSAEVGNAVANSLLGSVDPIQRGSEIDLSESMPPIFSLPKIEARCAILPGGLHYFKAVMPGILNDSKMVKLRQLTTLVGKKYTRIRFNRLGRICSIVFLGENEEQMIETNLEQLIGIHITYLNDIEGSLERGEVDDLCEFLSQDWATALYHDKFADFNRNLQTLLCHQTKEEQGSLLHALKLAYQGNASELDIRLKRAELIGPGGKSLDDDIKSLIQRKLINFLQQNAGILRMYHTR